jgi:hypothetical protein
MKINGVFLKNQCQDQLFAEFSSADFFPPFLGGEKNLKLIGPRFFRLGARDSVYYTSLRRHPFFNGIDFDRLPEMNPPSVGLLPLPPDGPDPCWKRCPDAKPGADRIPLLVKANFGQFFLCSTKEPPPPHTQKKTVTIVSTTCACTRSIFSTLHVRFQFFIFFHTIYNCTIFKLRSTTEQIPALVLK